MRKVHVKAKPGCPRGNLAVEAPLRPELTLEGTTLTGFRFREYGKWIPEQTRRMILAIPDCVDSLGSEAFRGWKALRHVRLGPQTVSLGYGVFSGCTALETAVLPEGMQKIPLTAFADCTSLRKVSLPDTITRINQDAFKNCGALEALELPAALETIEDAAFWGCRGLSAVCLPDALQELGADAFGCCSRLRSVQLPDSLREIGACAFQNCTALEQIRIPEGIRSLPSGAFAGCRSLRRVELPSTLETISPYAFYKCDNLEWVDHPAPETFREALRDTPFWHQRHPEEPRKPRLPMELLNQISGPVSGCMLCAMGYHWFDIDRDYRFFLTGQPGIVEVCSRYPDDGIPGGYGNDRMLMTEFLEPVPGVQHLLRFSDQEIALAGDLWNFQKQKHYTEERK